MEGAGGPAPLQPRRIKVPLGRVELAWWQMGSRATGKLETGRAKEVRARMVDMDGLLWRMADGATASRG